LLLAGVMDELKLRFMDGVMDELKLRFMDGVMDELKLRFNSSMTPAGSNLAEYHQKL